MANEHPYPSSYELQEVFKHVSDRKFLDRFAQSRGVFITNVNREELADELSNLFYEDADLEEIRREAYKQVASPSLSGFIVKKGNRKQFSLHTVLETVRQSEQLLPVGVTMSSLVRVPAGGGYDYKGSIEYTKHRPGKIALLQNESHDFDYYLTEMESGDWKVEVDCGTSNDAAQLKGLIGKQMPGLEKDLDVIELERLSTEQAITFFDELATAGLDSKEWTFVEVVGLTIKRERKKSERRAPKLDADDESEDYDDDQDEDDDERDLDAEEVTGISQAILAGRQLRDDAFVKKCVEDGYRFHSATYGYQSIAHAQRVAMRAEFKGRPKVFEVGIAKTHTAHGPKNRWKSTKLAEAEHHKLRSAFWNNSRTTFIHVHGGAIRSDGGNAGAQPAPQPRAAKTAKQSKTPPKR